MSLYTGTILAVASSTALSLGLFFMKRQADRLPSLGGGWRITAWVAFFRDPVWLLGVLLQMLGFGLYLAALRDTPLSVVHTAQNGGIALFVLLAAVGLHERPRPVEWAGVASVIAGLVALGLSLPDTAPAAATARGTAGFSLVVLAAAAVSLAADRAPRRPVGLCISAGVVQGLAGVFAKGLAETPSLAAAFASPNLPLTIATDIVGFALMQGALQAGRGVVTVPIFSVLSNLVPIIGGTLVFGEPWPLAGAAATLRPLSMLLALGGAALLGALAENPGTPQDALRATARSQ